MKINWAIVLVIAIVLIFIFGIALTYLSKKSDCESQEGIYDWRSGRCFEDTKEMCDHYRYIESYSKAWNKDYFAGDC